MLKILHVGPSLSLQGGIVTVIKNILKEDALFLRNGYMLSTFESTALRGTAGYFSFLNQILQFLCTAYSKDIIHFHVASHGSFYRKFVFFLMSKLLLKKTIIHLHGGGFFDFFDKSGKPIKLLIKFLFKTCTSVIVVSDYSAQELKKRIKINSTIQLIPNSSLEFEKLPANIVTHEVNDTILFCGTLTRYKGLDELLQAMKTVIENVPNVKLIVAGNGEILPWLKRAQELGVSDSINFCGYVTGEKKVNLYNNSTIFCLPSHYESFGIAALEAMHCGKAVVCTNAGGLPDLVNHQVNGLLSNPHDINKLSENLITLLKNKSLRDSYGNIGNIKAKQNFSSKQSLKNLLATYKKSSPLK
ncbi:glycosyltransferase family 4 protein [Pseudomonas sp. PDM29]|jgi:glycosyltransferase involved in cell wall biosynthesis|uniref:glycosyltransferase family 4 protein n=1 Tax=unclassified Pseudomonas TaxID=196821 RepID=UPI001C44D359|nr:MULTISPECIES: glycosyltransferase family 4 protein [unclassified Pseudomonas]MBV7523248.1 glycosyltransferase family 4 protein [Pseudomonas sp. PDM29]